MNKDYLENARKNGNEINCNIVKILECLTKNISLIMGTECKYDLLYNGSCNITIGLESFYKNNVYDTIKWLNDILNSLYH